MSLDLALIRFPGETKAASLFATMRASEGSHPAPWTHEVALVEHHRNGRLSIRGTFVTHYVDVDEADHVSESGALEGALTGALVGAIFGPPGFAAGLVLGGTVGAEAGRPTEVEAAPKPLVDALRSSVPNGASAIVLLAAALHVDAMLSALGDADGALFRRTLTAEQASALMAMVNRVPMESAGPFEVGQDAAPAA
jgi:uncharacterized membrane protein